LPEKLSSRNLAGGLFAFWRPASGPGGASPLQKTVGFWAFWDRQGTSASDGFLWMGLRRVGDGPPFQKSAKFLSGRAGRRRLEFAHGDNIL